MGADEDYTDTMPSIPLPILVVDRSPASSDQLVERLLDAGYEVDRASSGGQAVHSIGRHQYDMVLIDNDLEDLPGLDLLRLLRATHSAAALPVVLMADHQGQEQIVEALAAGADDYVTKPVEGPLALARIRSHVGRRVAERALKESEERYALAAQGAADGLWDWDVRAGRVFLSPQWKAIIGFSDDELGGASATSVEVWFHSINADDRKAFKTAISDYWASPNETSRFEHEHRMTHRDGTHRWVLCRGTSVRDASGAVIRMTGWLTDVTEARAFDPLTHLPNRLLFDDGLVRALFRSRELDGESFGVLMLDLDGFKLVNDSFGHQLGDKLLLSVADRLRANLRPTDSIVARLGGDEFAILVEHLESRSAIEGIAERLIQVLRAPFHIDNRDIFCTASVGVAVSDLRYMNASEMLRDADTAMYRAKTCGKGSWVVFDEALRENALARIEIHTDLQSALANDEFEVYYQPKIQLGSRQLSGFEALIRWNHPRRGLRMPIEFIGIAEENGTIVDIGAWVMETACRQIGAWNHRRPEKKLSINVNVSPRQLHARGFVDTVRSILERTGIDPAWLDIEVTESVFLENRDHVLNVLNGLKNLGVRLSVDDFGTGYSCLSYLCNLPFDTLKVDRSFVREDVQSPANQEVVKTILAMATELGMQVVAEGIESEEQAKNLNLLGCQYGQGYLFSRPLPEAQASALVH
jgi:diguanylate cyclase (GGDEF)-like protein/PAS domain S-box-containing protein